MKGLLRFFTSWILFGLLLYVFTSIAQGSFDVSTWSQQNRGELATIAGLGGFWFAVVVAIVTD